VYLLTSSNKNHKNDQRRRNSGKKTAAAYQTITYARTARWGGAATEDNRYL